MKWRTRLFEFPGGVLEVYAYGDETDDGPGVYMESFTPDPETAPNQGDQTAPEVREEGRAS
ncbi:hypothetical protein GCM10027089_00920 [Nocardia thraciensis]